MDIPTLSWQDYILNFEKVFVHYLFKLTGYSIHDVTEICFMSSYENIK